ncbi:MAG: long-chain fatty acid--CoA ligase, partial [Sphingomonadaceae bacterium]|nr:long-chain fatty acid--CoA ligase [Sphingomonadaceae bacterium]
MQTSLLLDIAADACDDRIAIGPRDDGISYAALRSRARAVARWLAGKDTQHTVFIGLNGAAMPLLLFASGMAGLPFVPINYRLSDEDLRKLAARTVPATVFIDDDMAPRVAEVEGVEFVLRTTFEARFLTGPVEESAEMPEDDNDIAILLFTSGTTGDPKAAVLRHANLTSYVMSTVEFLGSDEDEAALVSVPPYHIAGISAVLTSVYGG